MLQQENWFLPKEVLLTTARQQRDKIKPPAQERQAWSELRAAALFAYALMKLTSEKYVLKPIPLRNQAPDVTLGQLAGSDALCPVINQQSVEVVSYTAFSKKEGLADFLWRTKLNPHKKWYGYETLILCYVQACHSLDWLKIHSKLKDAGVPTYTVALLHNLNNLGLYEAGIIYPEIAWRTTFQFFPDVYKIEHTPTTPTATRSHSQNAQFLSVKPPAHRIGTPLPSGAASDTLVPLVA